MTDECTGWPATSFSCQASGPIEAVGGSNSVCGRPFLIDGLARSASLELCSGRANSERVPGRLESATARQPLVEHWAELALMEHASIAAFARFTLELLSLAAPAEFLALTQQAMADEIVHAELCFALASAYAEQPLAPSALEVRDALSGGLTRAEVVERAFLEACIGETLAVAEAQVALDSARDPAVIAALECIVRDEARHAELGWRFLAWALRTAAPAERGAMTATLQHRLEQQCRAAADSRAEASRRSARDDSALRAHGLVSESARRAARRAALDTVVVPCARALGIGLPLATRLSTQRGGAEQRFAR